MSEAAVFITLLGRPGAGKTTLGRNLEAETGLPYLGGSALLREYVKERRWGWRRVERNLERRRDSPPRYQKRILRAGIQRAPEGAILDGFPKTLKLCDLVDRALKTPIALAVYVEIPAEVAEIRISRRVVCTTCGMPAIASEAPVGTVCGFQGCLGLMRRRPEDDLPASSRVREGLDAEELRRHFAEADRLLVVPSGRRPIEAVAMVAAELAQRGHRPQTAA